MVTSGAGTKTVQAVTKTIPIIFVGIGDPIAEGIVTSLTRPGGNATGFTNKFNSIGGKWIELLKLVAPNLKRVGVLFNEQIENPPFPFEESAATLGLAVTRMPFRGPSDISNSLTSFAATPDGGIIITPPNPTRLNKETIIGSALRLRLPSIYQTKSFADDGLLITYGASPSAIYARAASYVDRILRGTRPADLPVEFPTKFELVINAKTAAAIGVTIPETLLATADEVIQ